MATLTAAARNAACNAIVDLVDVGAGTNGTLEIGTAGFASTLVTFDFAATAFGAASSGTATAASLPITATAAATGTAAEYRIRDQDNVTVWSGTSVGTSGTEVVLSSTSITSGQSIDLTACSCTMPAS